MCVCVCVCVCLSVTLIMFHGVLHKQCLPAGLVRNQGEIKEGRERGIEREREGEREGWSERGRERWLLSPRADVQLFT